MRAVFFKILVGCLAGSFLSMSLCAKDLVNTLQGLQGHIPAHEVLVIRLGYYGLLKVSQSDLKFRAFDSQAIADGLIRPSGPALTKPTAGAIPSRVYHFGEGNVPDVVADFFDQGRSVTPEQQFWQAMEMSASGVVVPKAISTSVMTQPVSSPELAAIDPGARRWFSHFDRGDRRAILYASLFTGATGVYFSQVLATTQTTLGWPWAVVSAGLGTALAFPVAQGVFAIAHSRWGQRNFVGEDRLYFDKGTRAHRLMAGGIAVVTGSAVNCALFMSSLASRL